jgi:hypothetical protein
MTYSDRWVGKIYSQLAEPETTVSIIWDWIKYVFTCGKGYRNISYLWTALQARLYINDTLRKKPTSFTKFRRLICIHKWYDKAIHNYIDKSTYEVIMCEKCGKIKDE